MKWRHWAILIVLVLLNYIIFSTAFTQLAEQRHPGPEPTRTLAPTFESPATGPVSWVIVPTNTTRPTRTPVTPSPTPDPALATATPEVVVATPEAPPPEAPTAAPTPTPSPVPASPTPVPQSTVHVVQRGETLSTIAQQYGGSVQAIVNANGLADPNRITVGQRLTIPAAGQAVAPPTARPAQPTQPANPPPPTATSAPAPTATRAAPALQFSASLVWDPAVAPNCGGPAIAKQSTIRDTSGNPVNGAVVQANCYDNIFDSHASGTPGEYEPGHYDFSFGQSSPQNWVCTFRVVSLSGQAVTSEVASVQFDLNDCRPNGPGHQVAILNWTKNW